MLWPKKLFIAEMEKRGVPDKGQKPHLTTWWDYNYIIILRIIWSARRNMLWQKSYS